MSDPAEASPTPPSKGPSRKEPSAVGARGRDRFLNRELSFLDFSERILALAEDPDAPLLERVKFLALQSEGLDERFQVRISGIRQQALAMLGRRSPDGLRPAEQLAAIRARVEELIVRREALFVEGILPDLAAAGILITSPGALSADDQEALRDHFLTHIFPVLTPLAVDPAHPFPYISDLSLNLAVLVAGDGGRTRFARLKVPPLLARFVDAGDGRYVPIEELVAAHLPVLFPGAQIIGHAFFRVTRSTEMDFDEERAEDLLVAIESVLSRRRRDAPVVRLEIGEGLDGDTLDLLMDELELTPSDVYRCRAPLDLGDLWQLYGLDRPDLKDPEWTPLTPPRLRAGDEPIDIFKVIGERDLLVHHPYESFATSVVAFIEAAARDPAVLAIKQTLYRTGGPESSIIEALIRAARSGKQVVALVELKARFDEEANIAWARMLEESGVHVVYGIVGLKTHSKTSLVVRQEPDGIRRYSHIGTGNYNAVTATTYEDIGLFTVDEDLCADLSDLFNYLTGYSRQAGFRKLLVSPVTLRSGLLGLIAEQAARGPRGHITIKVNNLSDAGIVDALYDASAAGARIELIVRSICVLRPGVPGLSESISVRSIVGRFLEHSRIYRFGPPGDAQYFIGSADLMPRNLDQRVEAVAPVIDTVARRRIDDILQAALSDDELSWTLQLDGSWTKARQEAGVSAQQILAAAALDRSRPRSRGGSESKR